MIQPLIIGAEADVDRYSKLITQSKYFGQQQILPCNELNVSEIDLLTFRYDAIFLVTPLNRVLPLFEQAIKLKNNFYFVDQPSLTRADISQLDHLYLEAGNLLFPEIAELEHPLVQDFISTKGGYLMFHYNKSISTTKLVRKAVLSALCFLSVLSPMQVKKIDINTIESADDGKPLIKIRLKMYDSSLAYIVLKLENKNNHNIMIETPNGSFTFNFSQNYLENINGIKFKCDPVSDEELQFKTIETFGLHIILNNFPSFSFHHYSLSINPLDKILNILQNGL